MSLFAKLIVLLTMTFTLHYASAAPTCQSVFTTPTIAPVNFSKFDYYLNKLREVKDLDRTAPFAMALRLLIVTTTNKVERQTVPLDSLYLIHPILREAALDKLNQRIQKLQEIDIEQFNNTLDAELLSQYLPSKNLRLRAIKANNGQYVIFDGNGRLEAIKNAFETNNINVEIDVYHSNSNLLQIILSKIRKMRGVMPQD